MTSSTPPEDAPSQAGDPDDVPGQTANAADPRAKTVFTPGGLEIPTILGVVRYFPGFLIRALVPMLVIVVGFSLLPTFGGWSALHVFLGELFFIVLWLALLFPLYLNHQIRRIMVSPHPQAAWMEALLVIATLFLAIFAHIYRVLGVADADSFTQTMDLLNSYYYSLTVLSTLGLGDITPNTDNAKIFTMIQIVCDIALITLVFRVLSSARGNAVKS